jgi:predicted ATPase
VARLRERIRGWRFYDHFRTDSGAPARLSQIGTHTPVLGNDGADLAAAIQTVREIGDAAALDAAVDDAFPGSRIRTRCHEQGRFELEMLQHGLHPDLLPPLARLIGHAAQHSQVLVVSHATRLIAALERECDTYSIMLEKEFGETRIAGLHALDQPAWRWPAR